MKYILDTSKLQPCDIILTRNKQLPSKFVRLMSAGAYSHALCCLTNTSLIEATIEGRVFSENPQRLLFENIDDCKVLRLKNELNQEDRDKIIYFLRTQVSTRYSVKEALLTARYRKTNKIANGNGQFCSRLVSQAFNEIDISLVRNPNYCSPENLNASTLLQTVPNALRMATDKDIEYYKTPSQIRENQIQNYKWLDKVAILARIENINILSQHDVGQFLIDYRKYDEYACNYIRETSYLTQYKEDELVSPYRYKYIADVGIDIPTEILINKDSVDRQLINYSRTRYYSEVIGIGYFLLLKEMYENILKQVVTRLDVLNLYINAEKSISSTDRFLLNKDVDDLSKKIKKLFIEDNYKEYI